MWISRNVLPFTAKVAPFTAKVAAPIYGLILLWKNSFSSNSPSLLHSTFNPWTNPPPSSLTKNKHNTSALSRKKILALADTRICTAVHIQRERRGYFQYSQNKISTNAILQYSLKNNLSLAVTWNSTAVRTQRGGRLFFHSLTHLWTHQILVLFHKSCDPRTHSLTHSFFLTLTDTILLSVTLTSPHTHWHFPSHSLTHSTLTDTFHTHW